MARSRGHRERRLRGGEVGVDQEGLEGGVGAEMVEGGVAQDLKESRIVFGVGDLEEFEGLGFVVKESAGAGEFVGGFFALGVETFFDF